jgi:hypothetical protein
MEYGIWDKGIREYGIWNEETRRCLYRNNEKLSNSQTAPFDILTHETDSRREKFGGNVHGT